MIRKVKNGTRNNTTFFLTSNSRIVSINSMAETEPKPKGSLSDLFVFTDNFPITLDSDFVALVSIH